MSRDPWADLRAFTPARIALGRAGSALPTRAMLDFALAHARARDAVYAELDLAALAADLSGLGLPSVPIASAAASRAVYLARPDLGRTLSAESCSALAEMGATPSDLAVVVGDGLSAPAVQSHAAPLLAALVPRLGRAGLTQAPVLVARGARVALGDEVGEALGVRAVLVLIGERPGLSAPDSLGAYLTFAPRRGRTDAERNCVSNIRPAGLPYDVAAYKLAWLIGEALRRGLTGVALKEESEQDILAAFARPDRLAGGRWP